MLLKRVFVATIFTLVLFDKYSYSKSIDNYYADNRDVTLSMTTNNRIEANLTTTSSNAYCKQPMIKDYPSDIFTQDQRKFGFILLHFAFAFYLLHAIFRVCDDYFMNSLEIIGQKLNLDQDVAGATFMAAGSSAPEVFISLIGVMVSNEEPVIGAIVGSAMFNILFVVGICGILVTGSAKLAIWPFFRDSIFYCISIVVLVLIISDRIVFWFESLFLICLYACYCIFMMNNDAMKEWAFQKFQMFQGEASMDAEFSDQSQLHNKNFTFISKNKPTRSQSGYNQFVEETDSVVDNGWGNVNTVDNTQSYQNWNGENSKLGADKILNADFSVGTTKISFATSCFQVMLSRQHFGPKTRFRSAVRRVICEIQTIKLSVNRNYGGTNNEVDLNEFDCNPMNPNNLALFTYDMPDMQAESASQFKFYSWMAMVPMRVLFHFTIPNCRIDKYRKYYVLTFFMSIVWLAILSYLIVWMITIIGYTFGIPDSFMLITFIAAGTSIPDAYTSMIVVKEGMVDMGVSNIFGSNVFDLLIGLAFPWFIKAIFTDGYIRINSNGLVYDTLIMFGCVFVTIIVIHVQKWHLNKQSGYIFLTIYAIFLIISSANELNLLGKTNPPTCF